MHRKYRQCIKVKVWGIGIGKAILNQSHRPFYTSQASSVITWRIPIHIESLIAAYEVSSTKHQLAQTI